MALVTNVSEADAGATMLKSPQLSAISKLKNETAMKSTPQTNHGLVTTAATAPMKPRWALMSSKSPIDVMPFANSTSPADPEITTAAMNPQA